MLPVTMLTSTFRANTSYVCRYVQVKVITMSKYNYFNDLCEPSLVNIITGIPSLNQNASPILVTLCSVKDLSCHKALNQKQWQEKPIVTQTQTSFHQTHTQISHWVLTQTCTNPNTLRSQTGTQQGARKQTGTKQDTSEWDLMSSRPGFIKSR